MSRRYVRFTVPSISSTPNHKSNAARMSSAQPENQPTPARTGDAAHAYAEVTAEVYAASAAEGGAITAAGKDAACAVADDVAAHAGLDQSADALSHTSVTSSTLAPAPAPISTPSPDVSAVAAQETDVATKDDIAASLAAVPEAPVKPQTKQEIVEEALNCPCIASMKEGSCGTLFTTAYRCFLESETSPKGMDCMDQFKSMQSCIGDHPDEYNFDDEDDDADGALFPTSDAASTSKADSPATPQTQHDGELPSAPYAVPPPDVSSQTKTETATPAAAASTAQ